MPYLIPNDHDGETYQCVEIHWPDSPQWWAILRGVISEMFRGRMWDETTGSIKDTQEIGREIWARSFPFMPCGTTDCPECDDGGTSEPRTPIDVGAGFDACDMMVEEYDMSSCGENGLPMKIEGNSIYWWKCCEWVLVGSITGSTGNIPDEPFNTDNDPEYEYSPCGKAHAIVETVYDIVQAGWDARIEEPWKWIPGIEDTIGYDLDNNWLLPLVTGMITFDGAGFDTSDLFSSIEKASIICRVYSLMTADANGIDSDTFEAIKSEFKAEFHPDILGRYSLFNYALNALGKDDMSTVAILGSDDTTKTCDCPDVPYTPEWPEGMDWEYYWDFETLSEMPDNVALLDSSYLTVGEGVRHYSAVSGLGNPTIESIINAVGGVVKAVYLRYTVGAGPGEGDYEGVQVQVATDVAGFVDQSDTGDTDPSAGGTFSVAKNQNYTIVSGDNSIVTKLEVRDEGAHTEGRTVTLRGFGLAGTGTDPALTDV